MGGDGTVAGTCCRIGTEVLRDRIYILIGSKTPTENYFDLANLPLCT